MNYIYDIYLNFNKELYDFFDWNRSDKLVHIKSIPVFKTTEENLTNIISHNIQLEENTFKDIYNKCTIWNKSIKNKSYALFCDNNTIIAIEFNENGKSINKSSLLINEELEILETTYKLKEKNINFKILGKIKNVLKTRNQIKEEQFVIKELKNISSEKLNYIYFECFGKREKNKNIIMKKLLNLSKNSKTYKNLYNILKLTSTTTK